MQDCIEYLKQGMRDESVILFLQRTSNKYSIKREELMKVSSEFLEVLR